MEPVTVGEETLYHIGDQYMVSVQKYQQTVRLQIRKYFFDRKQETIRPTKEGISLRTEDIEVLTNLPDDTITKIKSVKSQLLDRAKELAPTPARSSKEEDDSAVAAKKRKFFPE